MCVVAEANRKEDDDRLSPKQALIVIKCCHALTDCFMFWQKLGEDDDRASAASTICTVDDNDSIIRDRTSDERKATLVLTAAPGDGRIGGESQQQQKRSISYDPVLLRQLQVKQ